MIISIALYFQDFGPVANPGIADGYSHRSFDQAILQALMKPQMVVSSLFAFIGGSLLGLSQKLSLLIALVAGFSIVIYSLYLAYAGYYKRNPFSLHFYFF